MQAFDVELSAQDIQVLRDADSIAAFFTGLGYDTAARIPQTPANLGLSEPLQKRVKRIELIADQDKLFQVYLFELQSVTVADIKAIGRAFRDKAGNFLFVVTDDYEEIEFVLLDRIGKAITPTAISTASPSMTPRRFSVDRRHPTAVHRRVLRRFTWTETDQFGQFDKLRYAYDLAYWSEAFFNNRGLFSDYYLCERLPSRDGKFVEFSEWREDPKPAYQRLRAIYGEAAEKFAGKKTVELINVLYEPLLRELGFDPKLESPASGPALLRLNDPSSGALLGICLPYSWGRELDRKDDMHDSETPEATPIFTVVELLAKEQAQWVVLTNGKLWRLYSQRAHSRATNYYEIDLDEILGREGFQQDIQDAFRYFWLFFRMQAFRPVEQEWQGKRQPISLLDRLLLGSEEYAKHLGESLKSRVFTQVFPVLAEGFIGNTRQRGEAAIGEEDLVTVFQGTLTLLYRLLFLLYAEARDLLPVHSREYRTASLQRLKEEIREKAGTISESNTDFIFAAQERKSRIEQAYSISEFGLWRRLKAIFAVIDQGNEELNVPRYNGGLFLAQRERGDHSPEAEAARFLERERIADRHLALALDLLARDVDPKSNALVFIDYKSLGVRQLGSIYEGLLEFQLKIASEKLAIVKEKGREVYQSFKELSDREKKRAEAKKAFVPRAQAYLENDKRERKATGSYYTPDHIVQYIVEHAVGPVLKEKLDALRPKLRQAQQEHREFFKQREEFARRGMKSKPPEQADLIGRNLVDELFNIKVLDPAMGSGHFLVEAVDFITDKILEFLNAFPWNPILVHLDRMRSDIQAEMDEQNVDVDANRLTDVNLLKRHVLKRCVYGVDLNPMAVELAKVSLWLDCFTLGAPLSFLDHHLRWGNSLIGSTVGEVDAIREAKGQLTLTGTSDWQGLTQAVQTMIDVGGMPDITPAQVASSKQQYESALSGVEVFKRVLDLHTARCFVEIEGSKAKGKKKVNIFDEILRSGELFTWAHGEVDSPVAHTAMAKLGRDAVTRSAAAAKKKRFFHWELEFPEVFYGRQPGSLNVVGRLQAAGFDAIVGNPPYDVLSELEQQRTVEDDLKFYCSTPSYAPADEGKHNLYKFFICRALHLAGFRGIVSFIVPMSLLGNEQDVGLRKLLATPIARLSIEAFPQKDDPEARVFREAKLSTAVFAVRPNGGNQEIVVRTHPGATIDPESPKVSLTLEGISVFDERNMPFVPCSQRDWDIALRIVSEQTVRRLAKFCTAFQGEVNETTDGKRGFTSYESKDGPLILRGAAISLYVIREASQGVPLYLRKEAFLSGKPDSDKATHHSQLRVGWQESSAQNNFRRIIAASIPRGHFCNHKINYIPEKSSMLPLDFILALLNSKLSDWFFRLSSTSAAVSHYQIYQLLVPTVTDEEPPIWWMASLDKGEWNRIAADAPFRRMGCMARYCIDGIGEMCRCIKKLESKRELQGRWERSELSAESEVIQGALDRLLFRCFGLNDDEQKFINDRLKEML
jgi:hypothetical protein